MGSWWRSFDASTAAYALPVDNLASNIVDARNTNVSWCSFAVRLQPHLANALATYIFDAIGASYSLMLFLIEIACANCANHAHAHCSGLNVHLRLALIHFEGLFAAQMQLQRSEVIVQLVFYTAQSREVSEGSPKGNAHHRGARRRLIESRAVVRAPAQLPGKD